MARTYVVTGAASGIGQATARLLGEEGHRVIGVDLRDGDVTGDLSTEAGRLKVVDGVDNLSNGRVDGVIAAAGLAADAVSTAAVNFFGAVATLRGLRPLLAASPSPAAVVVTSVGATSDFDPDLLEAFRQEDEERALARAADLVSTRGLIYKTSKKAVARWVRAQAPTSEWAGAGIALNAVGPGMVETPMISQSLSTPEGRARLFANFPMPLTGLAQPSDIARTLIWLTEAQNRHITGQVIFVDGGAEAVVRGEHVI